MRPENPNGMKFFSIAAAVLFGACLCTGSALSADKPVADERQENKPATIKHMTRFKKES